MEKIIKLTPEVEVQRKGYAALFQELGVTDFIRFIQQFENGYGDYSKDRHAWQDAYSVGELVEKVRT